MQHDSIFAKGIQWQQMRIICCKLKHTSSVMHVKLVTRWEEPLCSMWRIFI